MKEKIQNFSQSINVKQRKNIIIAIGISIALVVVVTSIFGNKKPVADNSKTTLAGIEVITVGQEENTLKENNSWSGEIISLDSVQIQPGREGAIAEWYVHIGQKVSVGQALGKLSKPTQSPDAVSMLADKYADLSQTKTNIEAQKIYNQKKLDQLKQLKIDRHSLVSNQDGISLASISTKKELARSILRSSINKTVLTIYGQSSISSNTISSARLKAGVGALNSSLTNTIGVAIINAYNGLENTKDIPEQAGIDYFNSTIKLANASFGSEDFDLATFKTTLSSDQTLFLQALTDIKTTQLDSVNSENDIDSQIIDLEKTLTTMEGEITAKEGSYAMISNSVNGGYTILATKSGIVSDIMKQPGEFVSPGMGIATITTENQDKKIVRFKIPNNILKPKVNDKLYVIRPSFPDDKLAINIIGIGNSLDETGSFEADAVFASTSSWSVGSSVRVLIPNNKSAVYIRSSAVAFNDSGMPYVWAVSPAGRIYRKNIKVGRLVGDNEEIYDGLINGDKYILSPVAELKEDMLIDDIIPANKPSGGAMDMSSMGM